MRHATPIQEPRQHSWQWPIDLNSYDRTPSLSAVERVELETIMSQRKLGGYRPYQAARALQRLFRPINDVLDWIGTPRQSSTSQSILSVITQEMYARQAPFGDGLKIAGERS